MRNIFERLDRKCFLVKDKIRRMKRWKRLNENHRIATYDFERKRRSKRND